MTRPTKGNAMKDVEPIPADLSPAPAPPAAAPADQDGAYWEAVNRRRIELIQKKNSQGLSPEEVAAFTRPRVPTPGAELRQPRVRLQPLQRRERYGPLASPVCRGAGRPSASRAARESDRADRRGQGVGGGVGPEPPLAPRGTC